MPINFEKLRAEGLMVPDDHPIYSEPPSIICISRPSRKPKDSPKPEIAPLPDTPEAKSDRGAGE